MVGTQFEDQIGGDEDRETLRQALVEMIGLIFWIPFQSQEVVEESGEERKSPYLIYFFWSWLTHKQSIFESNFQPNLAIKAKLKSCIRLKPRPPSSFSEKMELYNFNDKFIDLSVGKPHQNFLKILSKEEETEIGRKKELMA